MSLFKICLFLFHKLTTEKIESRCFHIKQSKTGNQTSVLHLFLSFFLLRKQWNDILFMAAQGLWASPQTELGKRHPPLVYLLSFTPLLDPRGIVIMVFDLADTQNLSQEPNVAIWDNYRLHNNHKKEVCPQAFIRFWLWESEKNSKIPPNYSKAILCDLLTPTKFSTSIHWASPETVRRPPGEAHLPLWKPLRQYVLLPFHQ